MNDRHQDALLRQLGQLAAEREAAAREHDGEEVRPLDAAARARIVARLEQVVGEERPAAAPPAAAPTALAAHRRRRAAWLAWPLAAALLALLSALVYRALDAPEGGVAVAAADLPAYTLRLVGAVQHERSGGAVDESAEVAPGNRLQVILTPRDVVVGAVTARALVADRGDWREVDPSLLAVSEQGAVRLDAIVGEELTLAAGSAQLLLMVGDAASLPAVEHAVRACTATGSSAGERWRAFLLTLEIPPL